MRTITPRTTRSRRPSSTAVLNGYRVGEAPVVMEERMGGKSSISPFKSVYYMVKVSIALVVFRITSGRRKEGRA